MNFCVSKSKCLSSGTQFVYHECSASQTTNQIMLVLHGLTVSSDMFNKPKLIDTNPYCKFVFIELPGFGVSICNLTSFDQTIKDINEWWNLYMEEISQNTPRSIIAYSIGTYLSIKWISEYKVHGFDQLILACPVNIFNFNNGYGFYTGLFLTWFLKLVWLYLMGVQFLYPYNRVTPINRYNTSLDMASLLICWTKQGMHSLDHQLPNIHNLPVNAIHIFHGKTDSLSSYEHGVVLKKLFPHKVKSVTIIEKEGHFLFFNSTIYNLLKQKFKTTKTESETEGTLAKLNVTEEQLEFMKTEIVKSQISTVKTKENIQKYFHKLLSLFHCFD